MSSEFYVSRSRAEAHVLTYWHGEFKLSTADPERSGWWIEEHFVCQHDHKTPESASTCSHRAAAQAERTGRPPRHYINAYNASHRSR